jgi:hypothetical protein
MNSTPNFTSNSWTSLNWVLAALALALIGPARAQTFSDAEWVVLGTGMNGSVAALAVSGTNLYAGGTFTNGGGMPANYVAKWDGRRWSALDSGIGVTPNSIASALAMSGTDLYAAGWFATAGGVPAANVAQWDGTTWSALGLGITSSFMPAHVSALAVNGTDLYAGGWFAVAGGVPANNIAQWDGRSWSALGSGLNAPVFALVVTGTNLFAGGEFNTAGGVTVSNIAQWDGSAWSALGSGVNGPILALAVSGTNLYAGGNFTMVGGVAATNIAKWDGSAWSALGSGLGGSVPDVHVWALAVSGTDLYAGGDFTNAGGMPANHIAKWDGSAWSPMGSGMGGEVNALAADGAGHLFVGGAGGVAQANLPSVPAFVTSPQTQTAEAGAAVHFWVEVTGQPAPAYEWCQNGTNILSCANNELVLTNIPFTQSGTYIVVVTNVFGAVTSAPAALQVIPPVPRTRVPGVNLMAQAGNFLGLDYRDNLGPSANWQTMATMTLSNASQFYFDVSEPLPPQRFYRAWQMGTPAVVPSLDMKMVPAITLTGNIGDSLRLEYINQFGPIDTWVTLGAVTLTNTSQLYFDTSERGQPPRLYRIVKGP